MTIRPRTFSLVFASALALSGCLGSSDDKGDNGDSKLITPKPSTVEDANTAGSRKTALPEPPADKAEKPADKPEVKAEKPADKPEVKAETPAPAEPK